MSAVPSKSTSTLTSVGIVDANGPSSPALVPTAQQNPFQSNGHKDSANVDPGVLVRDSLSNINMVNRSSNDLFINGGAIEIEMDMDMDVDITAAGIHHGGMTSEITEIIQEDGGGMISDLGVMDATSTSLFSIDIGDQSRDAVYVAVGEGETSMDALLWTLNHIVYPPNGLVYLVHIFPPLKFVPGPMGAGKVPLSRVSPELAKSYLAQHRSQMRQLVSKYMDKCTAHQVQVDTILIESDSVPNAILELISVLNIPKLVVGLSKSNLSKFRGQKGSGIVAHQILENAPMACDIKIICQGKDVTKQGFASPPSKAKSPAATPKAATPKATASTTTSRVGGGVEDDEQKPQHSANHNSFSCCFKPNF